MVRKLLFLLLTLLSSVASFAKVWTADDIPMVHLENKMRYVCDPENLMSTAERDSADFYLRKLQTQCGVQTVFIVVNNVKNADCFRMAQDVGNKYGVGDKKNRRGLVIVIAVKDRRYFIAPGKGLEAELTDVECDDIAQYCIVPNMKVNDIDKAVVTTTKALYDKFKTGSTGLGYDDAKDEDAFWPIAIALIFCFGAPVYYLIRLILQKFGLVKRNNSRRSRRHDDDWFPPFIFGGGGGFGGGGFSGGGFSGGSFGGGSFGGGGAGGGW